MVGVKIPRVGVKITRGSLTPGGQAAQGVKINCYTGSNTTSSHMNNTGLANFCDCTIWSDISKSGFYDMAQIWLAGVYEMCHEKSRLLHMRK